MPRQRIRLKRKSTSHDEESLKTQTQTVQTDDTPDIKQIITQYQADPTSQQSQSNILHLQRTIGNQAVQSLLGQQTIQREDEEVKSTDKDDEKKDDNTSLKPPEDTISTPDGKKFEDFDGKQYRVTGTEPDRKVEEVKRMTTVDGDVYYVALGEVISFMDSKPVVRYYKTPKDLGDWYPTVTHVNGMNVKTQGGISDAMLLQQTLNEEIGKSGDDVALGQDAIDVLYTYSATQGFGWDLINCVKGKLGYSDQVIKMQTQMMMDAVLQGNLTYISAHSRGTIKTDNAVRNAFKKLKKHYFQSVVEEVGGSLDISEENVMQLWSAIDALAKIKAGEEMNKFIRLVYAGNAVEYPSSVLPIDFVVGYYDGVSITVGSITKWGVSKSMFGYGNDKSTMTKQWSGHGYKGYIPNVAKLITKKLIKDNESSD